MNKWVLDASAVLALLQAEPGADKVASIVESAVMSAVNWAEVVGKLANSGMPFSLAASMVDSLPVTLHPFTHDHARLTAELAPATKPLGLSLGDRACLALGLFTGWPVLTADRKWDGVDSKVAIEFIR